MCRNSTGFGRDSILVAKGSESLRRQWDLAAHLLSYLQKKHGNKGVLPKGRSLNFVVPTAATIWEAIAPMTRTKKNKEALSHSVNVQKRVRSDRRLRQLTAAIDFRFVGKEYEKYKQRRTAQDFHDRLIPNEKGMWRTYLGSRQRSPPAIG